MQDDGIVLIKNVNNHEETGTLRKFAKALMYRSLRGYLMNSLLAESVDTGFLRCGLEREIVFDDLSIPIEQVPEFQIAYPFRVPMAVSHSPDASHEL